MQNRGIQSIQSGSKTMKCHIRPIFKTFGLLLLALSLPLHASEPEINSDSLRFTTTFHDFGEISAGTPLSYRFKFTNQESQPATLKAITPACGCTSAASELRSYQPGEQGEVVVAIDTRGKQGIIYKSIDVTIEDPEPRHIELALMARLTPSDHPMAQLSVPVTQDPACKTCHLDPAPGLVGAPLYTAICGQCHGDHGKGASARALADGAWYPTTNPPTLRSAITDGIPGTSMAPYTQGVTPPLTPEQLESLLQLIDHWNDIK